LAHLYNFDVAQDGIKSMDPRIVRITDAFARFHVDTTNRFHARVFELVLTEAELDCIKGCQKTLKPVGEHERFA
jgi:hypothetical protein